MDYSVSILPWGDLELMRYGFRRITVVEMRKGSGREGEPLVRETTETSDVTIEPKEVTTPRVMMWSVGSCLKWRDL